MLLGIGIHYHVQLFALQNNTLRRRVYGIIHVMIKKNEQNTEAELINDRTVAKMLSMSIPWVRQERYKRLNSNP